MPAPQAPLRLAVIGAGAFGRNHLRVYRELELTASPNSSSLEGAGAFRPLNQPSNNEGFSPGSSHPIQLAALVDPNPTIREQAAHQYSIPAFATIDELLAANLGLDAASICVPTIHHAAVAEQLLRAGLDILIEKPFAATLEQADHILHLAAQQNRIVQIGHLERFNPAVTATVERLTRPMFFEAHRLSIFTPRSLDVDVVLDLMIHDLDIVLSLVQSPVVEVRATGIPILSRKVDIANVRVEFATGCVANFTASRVSTEQVRKLRLFQPHQYLSLDFARQELLSINVAPSMLAAITANQPSTSKTEGAGAFRPLNPSPGPSSPQHPTPGLSLEKLDPPRAEPLRLELEDFLRAIAMRTPPRVTAEAGRNALALALEINAQIAAHAQRAGLG